MVNNELRHIENGFVEIKSTDIDLTGFYVMIKSEDLSSIQHIGPIIGTYNGLHLFKDMITKTIRFTDMTRRGSREELFKCSGDVVYHMDVYINVPEEMYHTIVDLFEHYDR